MRLEGRRKLENREFKNKNIDTNMESFRSLREIINSFPENVDDEILMAARSIVEPINNKTDMDIEAVQKGEKKENILGNNVLKEEPTPVLEDNQPTININSSENASNINATQEFTDYISFLKDKYKTNIVSSMDSNEFDKYVDLVSKAYGYDKEHAINSLNEQIKTEKITNLKNQSNSLNNEIDSIIEKLSPHMSDPYVQDRVTKVKNKINDLDNNPIIDEPNEYEQVNNMKEQLLFSLKATEFRYNNPDEYNEVKKRSGL